MVYFINHIKKYIINKYNYIIMDIDNKKYDHLKEKLIIYKRIKLIKNIFKHINQEERLYYNICSFLYGNFIEIRFKDNNTDCFYFFKNDIISSITLYKYFSIFEINNKRIFRLPISYNKQFFNLIINYLIYNNNTDNIGTLIYNPKSWLYLKDKDNFNNKILTSLNYYKLKQFKQYLSFFKIKVLEFKITAINDIIHMTLHANIKNNKNLPIHKLI